MLDVLANTFMTATRAHNPSAKLTRVRDVRKWDAPAWWRGRETRGRERLIDLDKL